MDTVGNTNISVSSDADLYYSILHNPAPRLRKLQTLQPRGVDRAGLLTMTMTRTVTLTTTRTTRIGDKDPGGQAHLQGQDKSRVSNTASKTVPKHGRPIPSPAKRRRADSEICLGTTRFSSNP